MRQRRPRTMEERQALTNRRYFPGATEGRVANVGRIPLLPRGRTGSTGSGGTPPPKHFAEVLKAKGAAPATKYTLTYTPKDGWPLVVAGGVEQTMDLDWTIEGNVLTVLPAMDLDDSDLLWARYNWTTAGASAVGTALSVSNRSLTGTMPLIVPNGASVGDLALVHIASYEGAGVIAPSGDWMEATPREQQGPYPYGGVTSHILGKFLSEADLGATTSWQTTTGNICGGMAVFPGASTWEVFLGDSANVESVPVTHPAAPAPRGASAWYVASVGTSFSGSVSIDTGTTLWSREATYQHSATSQLADLGSDGAPAATSLFIPRPSSRIAQTVIVS